jgi:hypothetical protein
MSQSETALEVIEPGSEWSASSSPNPGDITRTIKRALATGHYMGAATSCSNLPLGCEVAFSAVKIDLARETYPLTIGKKRGIGKTALNRIGKAIGVNWDTRLSHRTDDGKDPCFASYKAVGHYRDFDGTWRTVEGEKQMDLREGTERAKSMKSGELSEARKFIAEHAQTKAQLRAIRSIGIETSYDPEYYDDPIICARLVFTGRSDNPEIQARFAELTAVAMLGGTNMLYGDRPQLPPIGPLDTETETQSEESAVATAELEKTAETTETATSSKPAETTTPSQPVTAYVLKTGRSAGKSVPAMADSALSLAMGYYDGLVGTTTDEAQLADIQLDRKAILAEVASRKAEEAQGDSQGELKL